MSTGRVSRHRVSGAAVVLAFVLVHAPNGVMAQLRSRSTPVKVPVADAPSSPAADARVRLQRRPASLQLSTLGKADLPERIIIALGEERVLDVGDGVSSLSSNPEVVGAEVELGYLRIRALRRGSGVVFLTDRVSSRAIPVLVIKATLGPDGGLGGAKGAAERVETPQQVESKLRLRTGGVIGRGSIGAQYRYLSGSEQLNYRGNVSGVIADHNYSISLSQQNELSLAGGLTPQLAAASVGVTGEHVQAGYGVNTGARLFTFPVGTRTYRAAHADARLGPVLVGGEIRGDWDSRSPLFDPRGFRGELGLEPVKGFWLAGGALRGLSPTEGITVPYGRLGLDYLGWSVRLQAAAEGALEGRPFDQYRYASSVSVASPQGPCRLEGQYADGSINPDSVGGLVLGTRHSIDARAGCGVGGFTTGVTVRRNDLVSSSGDAARVSPWLGFRSGKSAAVLSGTLFPSADLSTMGFSLQLRLSQWFDRSMVGLTSTAQYLGPTPNFVQTAVANVLLGPVSINASASLMHSTDEIRTLLASAGLSLNLDVIRFSMRTIQLFRGLTSASGNLLFGLSFTPVPAWSFTVGATIDPLNLQRYQAFGGLSWSFGDSLPREPLLSFMHSNAVDVEVFHDVDKNGTRDPGEGPLAGVRFCVKETCATSDASGKGRLFGLAHGTRRVRIDLTSLPGLATSTPDEVPVLVGGYSTPSVRFGARQRSQLLLNAFNDSNGNGRFDVSEPRLAYLRAVASSKSGETKADLRGGAGVVELGVVDEWDVRIDPSSVPLGFYFGGAATLRHSNNEFIDGRGDLGLIPLRSVQGLVCIDADSDKKCDSVTDVPVEGVAVSCGERVAVTDEAGRFLLPRVLNETCDLVGGELDMPAGVVQKQPPRLSLGTRPIELRGIAVPLQRDPTAKRTVGVRFNWPKVGPAVVAELGGYTLDGKAFRAPGRVAEPAKLATWKPPSADKVSIDRALKLLKEKQTLLSVQVSLDPALPEAKAKADADAMMQAFTRWLTAVGKVDVSKIVTEVVPSTGRGSSIGMRVYQFFRRLKPDEVKEMEEQKAREREERQKSLDEAKKAREAEEGVQPEGSGPQPSTGSEVPLKRLDVRVRMRMNTR